MTPAQIASRAKLDQLLTEFHDQVDAASDVEIAFMRRVAAQLMALSEQAPDAVLQHAMVLCGTAVTAAIAESHDRRSDQDRGVS